MSRLRKSVLAIFALVVLSVCVPMDRVADGALTEYQPAWGSTFHTNISNGENPQAMFLLDAGDNVTITVSNYTGDHNGTIGLNNVDFYFYHEISSGWTVDGSNRLHIETEQLKQTDVIKFWIIVVRGTNHLISGFLDSGGPSTPVGGFDWNITRSESSYSWDAEIQASLDRLTQVTDGLFSNQTDLRRDLQNLSSHVLEMDAMIASLLDAQQSLWDEIVAIWDNGTSYQTQIDSINAALNTVSGMIDALWGNITGLWANLTACVQTQNELRGEYVALSLDVQGNSQSILEIQSELVAFRSALEDQLTSLGTNISELQSSVIDMENALSSLSDIVSGLPTDEDLGLLEGRISSMEFEIDEMSSIVEGMLEELANITDSDYLARLSLLETGVQSLDENVVDLDTRLRLLEDRAYEPYNDTLLMERMKKLEDENVLLKNELNAINETLRETSRDKVEIHYVIIGIGLGAVGVLLGLVSLLSKGPFWKRK